MRQPRRKSVRSSNAPLRVSLCQYTKRLAELFGVEVDIAERDTWIKPGPIGIRRGGDHSDLGRFAVSYLFEELFSKYDDGKADPRKGENCLQRFRAAEELCRDTNWRFRDKSFLFRRNLTPGFSSTRALWLAQRKIEWLLGPYEDSVIVDHVGFGPGATTRLPRRDADLGHKLGGVPHATPAVTSFVRDLIPLFPSWGCALLREGTPYEIVQGNKVTSVPKNYKTDRMIAIEPEWNMFFQKGIGGAVRAKLRRVGIDLDDQSNNAFLAGLGSLTGELATIDLSMASDCVSYELVRFLLPPEWFDALEQCRSPLGVLASGDVCVYQKFSSMGNGATFELETLLFWGLCSAVVDLMDLEDRRVLVYGDDIVIPSPAFDNVCDVLTLAGFVPNPKKSFGSGPFRESCGSHFYEGHDVTPIYIREAVDRLDRLFLLHNNTCRLLERMQAFVQADPEQVTSFLAWLRSHAPEQWRKPRLPRLDIGDGAFYGSFEECTPKRLRHGWEGWSVKTLQSVPILKPVEDHRKMVRPFNPLLKGLWLVDHSPDLSSPLRSNLPLGWVGSLLAQREPARIPRQIDSLQLGFRWRVSKQIVLSLAADYCWWHCFAAT